MDKHKGRPLTAWVDEDIHKWIETIAEKFEWTKSYVVRKIFLEAIYRDEEEKKEWMA
ncbi:MAG: hypothetical protein U9P79_01470 [Candidatus Cloacimonadota bacterium]|nr:hypothetical protein [Candidatus Cloacimonadota bacterium]